MTAACRMCGYDADAVVTARWELRIDREIGSLNDRHVNAGAARYGYKRLRNMWQAHLRVGRVNERVPLATAKRRVTITRVYSGRQRQLDKDNLVGAGKSLVDAMVREGLITGDDPARAEIHYLQEPGTTRETVVLIEEMGT